MGAIIRPVNRTIEEKADPSPSITCPPPSASTEPFLEWRLIIVITDSALFHPSVEDAMLQKGCEDLK